MQYRHIAAGAAAAASFTAASALATPVTVSFDLTGTFGGSGSGSFNIEDSLIAPGAPGTTDVGDIDAFSVSVNDPKFGLVTRNEVTDIDIGVDAGGAFTSLEFSTPGDPSFGPLDSFKVVLSGTVPDCTEESCPDFNFYSISDIEVSDATVPEPGTLGVLTLGAAGLALIRRRRRQAA